LDEANLSGAVALVVGNEGDGMRRLVRESCDFLVKLPMRGRMESLNAAVAGSIVLYEILRQRMRQ
jgi:23S rRNA (guanosine2251-2'-O)-methyltransferase